MAAESFGQKFRRHGLVRVAPDAWAAMLAARPDLDGVPHVAGWVETGRPLIVRRFVPGEMRDRVPLGLPLPPVDGKRRISFAFSEIDLAPSPAMTLQNARSAAPISWQVALDTLIALGAEHGLIPRAYGGLLWQAATGLAYLTSTSDLDVFWPLATPAVPTGLLDGIARIAETTPMRLDGEILLPDGAGLQWRELFEAPESGEVLIKHLDWLEMRLVSSLRTAKES